MVLGQSTHLLSGKLQHLKQVSQASAKGWRPTAPLEDKVNNVRP